MTETEEDELEFSEIPLEFESEEKSDNSSWTESEIDLSDNENSEQETDKESQSGMPRKATAETGSKIDGETSEVPDSTSEAEETENDYPFEETEPFNLKKLPQHACA
ncbi:hypothetical protein MHBO_004560, partial [Bonamia ostreae]